MADEISFIAYQDALIELLASGLAHKEILERLKTDVRFDPYRDYVSRFDEDMVAVACELMGKWSRRKSDDGADELGVH